MQKKYAKTSMVHDYYDEKYNPSEWSNLAKHLLITREIRGDGWRLVYFTHGKAHNRQVAFIENDGTAYRYDRGTFMGRLHALADVGIRGAIEIRRTIATDQTTHATGLPFPPRGRVYTLHSPDISDPKENIQ